MGGVKGYGSYTAYCPHPIVRRVGVNGIQDGRHYCDNSERERNDPPEVGVDPPIVNPLFSTLVHWSSQDSHMPYSAIDTAVISRRPPHSMAGSS